MKKHSKKLSPLFIFLINFLFCLNITFFSVADDNLKEDIKILLKEKKFQEAIKLIDDTISKLPDVHQSLPEYYVQLSNIYEKIKRYDEVIKYKELAFNSAVSLYGAESNYLVYYVNSLARQYFDYKTLDIDKAETYAKKLLDLTILEINKINQITKSNNSILTGLFIQNSHPFKLMEVNFLLGDIYLYQKKYSLAENHFIQVIEQYKKALLFKDNSSYLVRYSYEKLIEIYSNTNNLEKLNLIKNHYDEFKG